MGRKCEAEKTHRLKEGQEIVLTSQDGETSVAIAVMEIHSPDTAKPWVELRVRNVI
jgi:hypothetical protein